MQTNDVSACNFNSGHRHNVVQKLIQHLFNRSGTPYFSAIYVMKNSFDFLKSRSNSLASYGKHLQSTAAYF